MLRRSVDDTRQGLLEVGSTEYDRLHALDTLRSICAQPYDADKPAHVRELKELWVTAFPTEIFPPGVSSARWKDLGFQGLDPRTDLRGAGFLGLVHLRSLLSQHGAGMVGLEEDLPAELFNLPIAIASINCSAMLLSYLQLAPKLTCAFMPGGRLECSNETLQAFLALGWEGGAETSSAAGGAGGNALLGGPPADSNGDADAAAVRRLLYVLQALHARLTTHLGHVWVRMSAAPNATIMDFPIALRETYAHMQRALRLSTSPPWRLEALIGRMDNEQTAGAPLLESFGESFGPLSDVVGTCVVQPTAWALTIGYSAIAGAYNAVIGLCFSAGPSSPESGGSRSHDKRQ